MTKILLGFGSKTSPFHFLLSKFLTLTGFFDEKSLDFFIVFVIEKNVLFRFNEWVYTTTSFSSKL